MITLKVFSKAGAMVPDFRALAAGRTDKIGWMWDPTLGDGVNTKGGFVRIETAVDVTPVSVDHLNEYKKALRDGDLLPADEATAEACGLPKPVMAETAVRMAKPAKGHDHD